MRKLAPIGLERAHDTLPDAVKELTGNTLVGGLWASYLQTLTIGPQTLLHGDPHIGNTYTLAGGEVGFLDWQVVRRGNWSHDVGYFIQSALDEDDRRRHEAELVEDYRRALDIAPASRPGADDAWLRYRATPVHGLTMWIVTLLSDVHAPERSLALASRYATAFADLGTPHALDALRAGNGSPARHGV
jgi:aminoglycoside phosphotransferase (APT) family kinase protein